MPKNNKTDLSLESKGLRYRLKIAFYLMSVLPLLVCIYLVSNYIFPYAGLRADVIVAISISILIAIIGFYVVRGIVTRVLTVSSEAKLIASGDTNRRIEVRGVDEVGELEGSLNMLTVRIRSNIDELKNYRERTSEIDLQIQKRLYVLTTLLQVSSLILQGAKLDEIFKATTVKARLLAKSSMAYLFFRKEAADALLPQFADGVGAEKVMQMRLGPEDKFFSGVINSGKPFILDKDNSVSGEFRDTFEAGFGLKNTLALPVFFRGRTSGILGIGNTAESFVYNKDDIELLDIFAKQISIALENDSLSHRLEKLEIKDDLTGLYNETFIKERLEEEIRRAVTYQRPCAFLLLDADNFKKVEVNFGSLVAESTLKKIAYLIRDSVTEIDRVARIGHNEFAIVLPERNKRQAQFIAEEIRKKVEFAFSEERDPNKKLSVSGGVSENPLDGVTAEELMNKASSALAKAKADGKNRILG